MERLEDLLIEKHGPRKKEMFYQSTPDATGHSKFHGVFVPGMT